MARTTLEGLMYEAIDNTCSARIYIEMKDQQKALDTTTKAIGLIQEATKLMHSLVQDNFIEEDNKVAEQLHGCRKDQERKKLGP